MIAPADFATRTSRLLAALAPVRERLLAHPLYASLRDERTLRRFMRMHVFAVWDFQSLLKGLQRAVTCVEVPWLPSADPVACRLINEIVLDEESDRMPDGAIASHFEMYRRAMRDCGADHAPVDRFVRALRDGHSLQAALDRSEISNGAREFVATTLETASCGVAHRIAAAFAYGREEVNPAMFTQLVARLADAEPERWGMFRFYLERHISADAEEHGPRARELVERACGDDDGKWREAASVAIRSLEARCAFWDAILASLSPE